MASHEICLYPFFFSTMSYITLFSMKSTGMFERLPEADVDRIRREAMPIPGLTGELLRKHRLFPFNPNGDQISLILTPETQWESIEAIEKLTQKRATLFKGDTEVVDRLIQEVYEFHEGEIEDVIRHAEDEVSYVDMEESLEHLKDMASEAPVIRLVNLLIRKALEMRASDIHFEPFEREFKVRYRIDGVLQEMESPPKRLQAPIISRLKLMANLNIAERRLPQDGRIKLRVGGREVDIRLSTIPTLYGESVVLRLLNQEEVILDLNQMGFTEDILTRFNRLIRSPYGIILVTGPTGSGKTTTLYGALSKINTADKKIITVEDPVEYQLNGINQVQAKPQIGLTFASALRSILRQDPDVILIGEIRDLETAEIAVQASLTGHLVFSTLHTNDAASAATRLRDIGVENYLIASSLIGVMAQRLLRVLCPKCKEPVVVDKVLAERIREETGEREDLTGRTIYKSKGCEECAGTGYRGRTVIAELLTVNDTVRRAILKGATEKEIREAGRETGFVPMRENGMRKVKEGITTVAELLRVTQ